MTGSVSKTATLSAGASLPVRELSAFLAALPQDAILRVNVINNNSNDPREPSRQHNFTASWTERS